MQSVQSVQHVNFGAGSELTLQPFWNGAPSVLCQAASTKHVQPSPRLWCFVPARSVGHVEPRTEPHRFRGIGKFPEKGSWVGEWLEPQKKAAVSGKDLR